MPKYIQTPNTIKKLENPRIVNYYNNILLGQCYYISNNKIYRKMKCGDYREIMPQKCDGKYVFYFLKNKSGGKSRIFSKNIINMEFKNEDEIKQMEHEKSKEKLIIKINVTNDGVNVENNYPDKVTVIINQS
jgi:hypothetical protein